jgi:serralysin
MANYVGTNASGFNSTNLWVQNTGASANERFEGLISSTTVVGTRTETYSRFVFESGGLTYEYEGQWTLSAKTNLLTSTITASGAYTSVTVRSGSAVVARATDISLNVDFGARTSLTLLDLLNPILGPVLNLLFGGGTTGGFANLHTDATPNIDQLAFQGADLLQGGSQADVLVGYAGNDTLNGGAGADRLDGGLGDDVYYIDDLNDVVIDAGGNDRVIITVAGYDLSKLSGIENVVLPNGSNGNDTIPGSGGDDSVDGGAGDDSVSGGPGNDVISGGPGNDTLSGGDGNDRLDGGPGADRMSGGAGDDIYIVDNPGDVVIEGVNQGYDTVYASISYALTDNVEALFLESGRTGFGNGLSNVIYGNASKNSLYGFAGNDEIHGRSGNDYLSGSIGHDRLYGDKGNDRLLGGSGNDTIDGGYGRDTLSGGSGRDSFVFKDKLSKSGNLDKITDFNPKHDRFLMDNRIFNSIGEGSETKPLKMNKAFFKVGDGADDENDYVIYNNETGYLYYDRDGSGSAEAVAIAKLKPHLQVTPNDFFVI